jgi:signal transduction histidine kinase
MDAAPRLGEVLTSGTVRAVPSAIRQQRMEWALLALLLVLCAALSWLQFRWTGALSRAERQALDASLTVRMEQAAGTFDADLRRLCTGLVPTAAEIDALGIDAAMARRVAAWRVAETRRPFRHVLLVVAGTPAPDPREVDLETGGLRAGAWPDGWDDIRRAIERRSAGDGPPPRIARDSLLLEVPILGRPRERGWMVFELDAAYLRSSWLPDLAAAHFRSSSPQGALQIAISSIPPASTPLFSWPAQAAPQRRPPDAEVELFPVRLLPGPRGEAPLGRRWRLHAWYARGPIDAVVYGSRWRNLGISLLLVGMVLAAAWALLRVTARARALARQELEFVAGVSHELRTPLTVIRGAGHNLRSGIVTDPARQHAYAELIVTHADQLGAMIEQLLSLASTRRGDAPIVRERVVVADVVERALGACAASIAAAACEVERQVEPGLPDVLGNADDLRRALQNLIGNAATHGASGRWVRVCARRSTRRGSEAVEICVADRGPGVPEAERPGIWEPFVRGAAARARQVRGFGVGLSLVRQIAEAHGGTVSHAVPEGGGAEFCLTLPAAPREGR